jgi:hypothetical protein
MTCWLPGLEILRLSDQQPLYVDASGVVFLGSRGDPSRRQAFITTVPALTTTVTKRLRSTLPRGPGRPLAADYLRNFDALQFSLRDLEPYLQVLGGGRRIPIDENLVRDRLGVLGRQAARLRVLLEMDDPALKLAEALRIPCMISRGRIVPLQHLRRSVPRGLRQFEREDYRLCEERSVPLETAMAEVADRARRAGARRDRIAEALASPPCAEFVAGIRQLLKCYRPRRRHCYKLLYSDTVHELQESRGFCVLVRRARTGPHRGVAVGLPIGGSNRAQILAAPPGVSEGAGGFWGPDGRPAVGRMCMGDRRQYRRFMTDQFSDAEAVVQWLHVGVLLSLGISHGDRLLQRLLAAGRERLDPILLRAAPDA